MQHARALHVHRGKMPKPPRPLAERGRILYAEDVQEIYGKKPNGAWRRSIQWIQRNFAPKARNKDGREVYWWEKDALAWMDTHRESAA